MVYLSLIKQRLLKGTGIFKSDQKGSSGDENA
jgi:hypothetical protein